MPAINTESLLSHIWGILTPAQHAQVTALIMGGGGSAGMPSRGNNRGGIATSAGKSIVTKASRNRTTTRKTATKTATATGGKNTGQLLSYFQQHPTANLTMEQLAEVSPFKTWAAGSGRRNQIIGTALSRLVKANSLTKTGDSYTLRSGTIDRTLTGGARQAA